MKFPLLNIRSFLLIFLSLILFFSCSEEEAEVHPSEGNIGDVLDSATLDTKTTFKGNKNASVSKIAYFTKPIDNAGKLVLDKDGSTTVTWVVKVTRSNTNEDINMQFVLTDGFPTWGNTYGEIYVRTLDMGSSLQKIFTRTSTVTGAPGRLYIVSRNYLTTPAQTIQETSIPTISADLASLPDLNVRYLNSSPITITQGRNTRLEVDVRNIGTACAASFTLETYFSSSSTFNGTGKMGVTQTRPGLCPPYSGDVETAPLIIGSKPKGTYYVHIVVDRGNSITESNEGNNIATVPLIIR